MLLVVFDTQLLLRSLVRFDTLTHKLVMGYADRYRLVYSSETRAEILNVVNRPKTRKKFQALTDESISLLNNRYQMGLLVTLDYPIPAVSRDPKDDIFLATALAGSADYLVTQDQDLLVLGRYHDTQITDLPTFWGGLQSS